MGCGSSKVSPEAHGAAAQHDKIEKRLKLDRRNESRTVKILLLGAGESGKSTIIKQMRILHSNGFQDDERLQTRSIIHANIIVACKVLLEIMDNQKIQFEKDETQEHADLIRTTYPDSIQGASQNAYLKIALEEFWADKGVQEAVTCGYEYALNDNIQYYFQELDRVFEPDWLPNDKDMLHARLRTTGITETFFQLKDMSFRMMDVGGQRSERKKWIHCFEGVQCLLFLASLSGYDQSLLEDINANQMHEALMLFEGLINGDWFKNKPIILFLNKRDLFRDKLAKSPITTHFPDYTGQPDDPTAAERFFANKFRRINRNADREIYVHFTTATDTNLLKATMQSVQDILIQKQLSSLGF